MKRKIEDIIEENDTNKKQKTYDNCPICLECIQNTNYVVTKCNHKFCFSCLIHSCNLKNQCPLCRSEIEEFKNQLPKFRNSDMFDNIISSINNRYYNIFDLIDKIKESVFEEITEENDQLSDRENIYKNSIFRRLELSLNLNNNIDFSLMDHIQEFISKVIIDNTYRMCEWYRRNY